MSGSRSVTGGSGTMGRRVCLLEHLDQPRAVDQLDRLALRELSRLQAENAAADEHRTGCALGRQDSEELADIGHPGPGPLLALDEDTLGAAVEDEVVAAVSPFVRVLHAKAGLLVRRADQALEVAVAQQAEVLFGRSKPKQFPAAGIDE